ncbi:hypothetical protein KY290_010639 [Solanum tuberosum]|uniref:Uncharacterized protein n=1 Tax=Solanum tuberosum TaxID=4113 RepID=A0ABQ7VYC7_SOLTU|nr:hypothetical protein KY290_010639 [Solanum tuberosum]
MEPKNHIFPLKMCGEGTVVKRKKRKVDSSKYVHVDDDSPILPVLGPFESLASELNIMKEIVARLPQGSGESSSGPRSYEPQCNDSKNDRVKLEPHM